MNKINLPTSRSPGTWDHLIFLVLMPLLLAAWLCMSGNRLVANMSVWHGYLYMTIHCTAAWWAGHLGSRLAHRCLMPWRPPFWVVAACGWALILAPTAAFYYWLSAALARYYPPMAPMVASVAFEMTADYPLRLLRGSVPWLLLWLLANYGYRLFGAVDWYGYAQSVTPVPSRSGAEGSGADAVPIAGQVPDFLRRGSRLPLNAEILALKAEEHYLRIWSTAGKDLVRCRFKDAVAEMPAGSGLQVHRSWWVNPRHAVGLIGRGRKLDMGGGLLVPVSEAHRGELKQRLPRGAEGTTGRAASAA